MGIMMMMKASLDGVEFSHSDKFYIYLFASLILRTCDTGQFTVFSENTYISQLSVQKFL